MENKIMPNSSKAESVLLGGILSDPSIYDSVANYINEDVLYENTNKILWNKVGEMIKNGYHL